MPQIGSFIESKSGLELVVVGVTYRWDGSQATCELGLPPGRFASIEAFNKWDTYRPRMRMR